LNTGGSLSRAHETRNLKLVCEKQRPRRKAFGRAKYSSPQFGDRLTADAFTLAAFASVVCLAIARRLDRDSNTN
jgi:hypothetical protein